MCERITAPGQNGSEVSLCRSPAGIKCYNGVHAVQAIAYRAPLWTPKREWTGPGDASKNTIATRMATLLKCTTPVSSMKNCLHKGARKHTMASLDTSTCRMEPRRVITYTPPLVGAAWARKTGSALILWRYTAARVSTEYTKSRPILETTYARPNFSLHSTDCCRLERKTNHGGTWVCQSYTHGAQRMQTVVAHEGFHAWQACFRHMCGCSHWLSCAMSTCRLHH